MASSIARRLSATASVSSGCDRRLEGGGKHAGKSVHSAPHVHESGSFVDNCSQHRRLKSATTHVRTARWPYSRRERRRTIKREAPDPSPTERLGRQLRLPGPSFASNQGSGQRFSSPTASPSRLVRLPLPASQAIRSSASAITARASPFSVNEIAIGVREQS
jgi:hypothetical protein